MEVSEPGVIAPSEKGCAANSRWVTLATAIALALVLTLLSRPALHAVGMWMDEGVLLVYPEQIAKGKLPYCDFETFYPPGNLWFLGSVYHAFGNTVTVERIIGLLYRIALVLGLFLLARKWGLTMAIYSAVLCIFLLVSMVNPVAFAWFAALPLAIWSSLASERALSTDVHRAKRALFLNSLAGLLAGAALLVRLDLAPAILAAALTLCLGMTWRQRAFYLAGLIAPLLPLVWLACLCGFQALADNLFIYPVLHQSAGRRLPLLGPRFPYLVLCLSAAVLAVVASVFLVRRSRADRAARVMLALSLFTLGTSPQALQRLDALHVSFFGCIALPWCIVPVNAALQALKSNWAPRLISIAVFGLIVVLLALAWPQTFTNIFGAARLSVRRHIMLATDARVRTRQFPLAGVDATAVERVCKRILSLGKPGQRLFVGPHDLRRTNYNDTFIYYLLPEFPPATYFLEMNPLSANRPNSRLAADLATADWVILDAGIDLWNEPNASRQFGSDEPLRVLQRDFVFVAQEGKFFCFAATACRANRCRSYSRLWPLIDGNHFLADRLAGVFAERAVKTIVLELFENVRAPTRRARDGEDRREQIRRNAERVINGRRIKIDVRVQVFLLLHQLGDPLAHPDPFRFADFFAQLYRHRAQMRRARIERFVNAMPDAHDLLLFRQLLLDVGIDVLLVADFLQHLNDAFVRAAVQRPFKVPMADVIAEYISLSVEIVTRALKVDAFMP